jgi:hypothetical protein
MAFKKAAVNVSLFIGLQPLSGFRCQCSGVTEIKKTGHSKQMKEDKRQVVFCIPSSVCGHLTPEH